MNIALFPSPPAASTPQLTGAAAVLLPVAAAALVPGAVTPRFDQALLQLLQAGLSGMHGLPDVVAPSVTVQPQPADLAMPATTTTTTTTAAGALPVPSTELDDTEAAAMVDTVAPDTALLASMWPVPLPVVIPVLPAAPLPATAKAQPAAVPPAVASTQGVGLPPPTPSAPPVAGLPDVATVAPVPAAVARLVPSELADGLALLPNDRSPATSASVALAQDTGLSDAGDAAAPADATARRPQTLVDALGDRIAWQLQRGNERVVIRLDPPLRGQIEIQIRHDAAGATQVQLHASHGEVVRQLQAIGDHLRQELSQRQGGGDVSVHIAQQPRDHDGRQRQDRHAEQQQQQPGRALDEHSGADGTARFALATGDAR